MRQLHVVGVSDDGRLLLLAPSPEGKATHGVELDQRLERAVRGRPLDEGTGATSFSPREIQARLRAGASVEQVAREAGVPIGRVERFAGPVLSEREKVISAAQSCPVVRPRATPSLLPLGAAVEKNLRALAYVRPETAEWSAYRQDNGDWHVRFEVVVRGRRRTAEWAHQPATREVVPLNSYALTLGVVEAGRTKPAASAPEPKPAKRAVPTKAAKAPAKAAKPPVKRVATKAAGRGPKSGSRKP